MSTIAKTTCLICHNTCPIEVEVSSDGKATRVIGNRTNTRYQGFTCVKGRGQVSYLNSPERLLRPQKRNPDGTFTEISSAQAMDEIAEKLTQLIAEHGPRSISTYLGTMAFQAALTAQPLVTAFMDALGATMRFDSSTIDQPGKLTAKALHGVWMAPRHTAGESEVLLLIGANPMVSMFGLNSGNPGTWLMSKLEAGAELFVVDPRFTETAKRATLHLQPKPGADVPILAAILRVILAEGLGDADFVAANVAGVEALRAAVEPFTPERVADVVGVSAEGLYRVARAFGSARTGYVHAGTGPNMGQSGTLLEYLLLNLTTLCGHLRREGERVPNPVSLFPAIPAVAQAMAPFPARGYGEQMRVRSLTETPAGIPCSAAAEEILLEGEGKIRALFSVGGNPVAAWPDQLRTVEAMKSLDLLVQVDPFMSQTASYADYIIPPPMSLERPHVSQVYDLMIVMYASVCASEPYAAYAPAVVEPPSGSDLLSEGQLFYGLAQRMGLQLTMPNLLRMGDPFPLSMENPPTEDELIEMQCAGSRIPLGLARQHPDGMWGDAVAEPAVYVAPGDPASEARLDVGNAEMMADLAELAVHLEDAPAAEMMLISRREMHVENSSFNAMAAHGGRRHNPAYMNEVDIQRIGSSDGGVVRITSARSSVLGIVSVDETVRPGLVSMSHAQGDASPEVDDPWISGTSTARLSDSTDAYDRYTGQPRMSAIPVKVTAHHDELQGVPQS